MNGIRDGTWLAKGAGMTKIERKGSMKATRLLAAALFCLPLAATAQNSSEASAKDNSRETAKDYPVETSKDYSKDNPLFLANEVSLDLFGTASVGQETLNDITDERVKDDGRLGLGLGVNYFFTRHLGLGGDAYTENVHDSFVDNASGNLIFRIPLDEIHLAPYAYGGGGRQFDPTELWFAQAGAGLEVRFTRHFGLFLDGRYVFTDGTGNIGVGRLGLRGTF